MACDVRATVPAPSVVCQTLLCRQGSVTNKYTVPAGGVLHNTFMADASIEQARVTSHDLLVLSTKPPNYDSNRVWHRIIPQLRETGRHVAPQPHSVQSKLLLNP